MNLIGLSDEELVREYQKSDILAFASTLEGFGMPIVEAQIVGRPVVTSNRASMPEVLAMVPSWSTHIQARSIRDAASKKLLSSNPENNL